MASMRLMASEGLIARESGHVEASEIRGDSVVGVDERDEEASSAGLANAGFASKLKVLNRMLELCAAACPNNVAWLATCPRESSPASDARLAAGAKIGGYVMWPGWETSGGSANSEATGETETRGGSATGPA